MFTRRLYTSGQMIYPSGQSLELIFSMSIFRIGDFIFIQLLMK